MVFLYTPSSHLWETREGPAGLHDGHCQQGNIRKSRLRHLVPAPHAALGLFPPASKPQPCFLLHEPSGGSYIGVCHQLHLWWWLYPWQSTWAVGVHPGTRRKDLLSVSHCNTCHRGFGQGGHTGTKPLQRLICIDLWHFCRHWLMFNLSAPETQTFPDACGDPCLLCQWHFITQGSQAGKGSISWHLYTLRVAHIQVVPQTEGSGLPSRISISFQMIVVGMCCLPLCWTSQQSLGSKQEAHLPEDSSAACRSGVVDTQVRGLCDNLCALHIGAWMYVAARLLPCCLRCQVGPSFTRDCCCKTCQHQHCFQHGFIASSLIWFVEKPNIKKIKEQIVTHCKSRKASGLSALLWTSQSVMFPPDIISSLESGHMMHWMSSSESHSSTSISQAIHLSSWSKSLYKWQTVLML